MMDIGRMFFADDFFDKIEPYIQEAFKHMETLEGGSIANPDEKRMVGHYWLRNSQKAPNDVIRGEIENTLKAIKEFAADVHSGKITAQNGKPFKNILVVGIGGSALGPQFAASSLCSKADKMKPFFFDNTDPDGMDMVMAELSGSLSQTLCLVISKSGGTPETRNGMLEAKAAYEKDGLSFAAHTVAVTGSDSKLDNTAKAEGWIKCFPMWDWVGGRTSELSAVGLLPAALQGIDIDDMLKGARLCDEVTRTRDTMLNPAALLSLMWYYATSGRGSRDMVILPYKDRLGLFTKYLQQLIMESLGKEKDLGGRIVNQGITVYGNKGSTDQHAYVQQLRDGVNNFFVTFIEVLKDRETKSLQVEPDITSGDFLNAFYQGTRQALSDSKRESVTITIETMSPFTFGVLVALYERAVGLYAYLININAYHQPGVEAGKKAAGHFLGIQRKAIEMLRQNAGKPFSVEEIASHLDIADDVEPLFKCLLHASRNIDHNIKIYPQDGQKIYNSKFSFEI